MIALWLGHAGIETTQIYLDADLRLKERALARTTTSRRGTHGRYQPADALLAWLSASDYADLHRADSPRRGRIADHIGITSRSA